MFTCDVAAVQNRKCRVITAKSGERCPLLQPSAGRFSPIHPAPVAAPSNAFAANAIYPPFSPRHFQCERRESQETSRPLTPPSIAISLQVTELNLDNCRSTNIVGLTEEFANLTKLSLINVGLTSLKGFPKLPKLKKLELSDNRISNGLGSLAEVCPSVTILNLSGNRLKDLEALKPLDKFSQLEVLDLFNNEATTVDNYRDKLFAMIPSLKYLDG